EAGVAIVLAVVALVLRLRVLGRARALAAAALLLVYGFGYWKEAFVRHDVHGLVFFAAVGIGLLPFTCSGPARVGAPVATLAGAGAGGGELGGSGRLRGVGGLEATATALRESVVPARRRAAVADARELVRSRLGLDPALLAQLRAHTVDVGPYETSAVWAYGL